MPASMLACREIRCPRDAVIIGGVTSEASGTCVVSGDQPLPWRSGNGEPGMKRGVSVIGNRRLNVPSS